MRLGKLSNEDLKKLVFDKIKNKRKEIILRPDIGEDCAAVDFGGDVCVLSTDPITAASADIGSLSVHVSCNDVASSGAEPLAIMITMLIPPDVSAEEVERITDDIMRTADSLNVDVIGGHTEVTDAVKRVVISGTVVGRAKSGAIVKSSGAKEGDAIIMTKYAATEGTAIIANDFEERLKGILKPGEIKKAKALSSSFSVVKEGLISAEFGVSAMHDVTEGGVIGAVVEICAASRCGAVINTAEIPLLHVTKKICAAFDIDPLRLISSGSMLIIAKDPGPLVKRLESEGVKATVIGNIIKKGVYINKNGVKKQADTSNCDEIYKLYG